MMLLRLPLLLAALIAVFAYADPAGDSPQPELKFPTGKETVAKFTVPPGFVAKCFASEPDVRKPIAIDFDSRGRVWVLECFTYPRKAPEGQGKDRIRIFEDTDGDGVFDKVTTFAEGLNLATGMAVGYGGVFVGEAPYLVFLEDTTGGDHANKRTVLLDGWGYQDTHETLNSFIWGPDGWLYGCHGVFTNSNVGKPGCKPAERVRLNAGIWRFHPKTHAFELFAEGGSNQWGYDYDEHGEGFFACCVIPHLFHVIPGGRYARQAGQNFNPYNYGEIKWICEDLHYFGNIPHQGNKDPRSLKFGGGHAHAGCLVYQGGAYPPEWNGKILMNNIHGGRINADKVRPNGSTYIGNYHGDLLVSNDPNFRVVQLRTGPDGSVFMIDWYDPLICHNTDPAVWNRNYGRIYKLEYHGEKTVAESQKNGTPLKLPRRPPERDLAKLSSSELVDCLFDDNSWVWRKALLILAERGDKSVVPKLKNLAMECTRDTEVLKVLWALNDIGALDAEAVSRLARMHNSKEWVRAWLVRLTSQGNSAAARTTELIQQFIDWKESDPRVLREMASALQRIWREDPQGASQFRDVLSRQIYSLGKRAAELNDPALDFMTWLAYEPAIDKHISDFGKTKTLSSEATSRGVPYADRLADSIHRRHFHKLAAQQDVLLVQHALELLASIEEREPLLRGMDGALEGLRGRRISNEQVSLKDFAQLMKPRLSDPEVLRRYLLICVHFGDREAVADMESEVANASMNERRRIEAIQAVALARLDSSVKPLLTLATSENTSRLRTEAIRALSAFTSSDIAPKVLATWTKASPELRKEIVLLLVSKKPWAGELLDALKAGTVKKEDLTENDARRILAFNDKALSDKLEAAWGRVRTQTPANIKQMLDKYSAQLQDLPADRAAGKAVFAKTCQTCHKLFGEGHTVGPELTGANRRDPNYLLENILDPNKIVGKEYYATIVEDKRGVLHTGLLAEDTPDHVTLREENDKLTTIPRSEVEQVKVSDKSLMPEGLPNNMTDAEFRNLIAYLMEDPMLSQGLITGPFKMALDYAGPIETAADPLHTEGVKWKPFAVGPFGMIDMEKQKVLAPPTDSTAYVYFEVKSPAARTAVMEMAAHEDLKVWLNGKVVFGKPGTVRPQRVEVELKEGVNKLMFKVHNIYGPSWLWARLSDPRRELEVLPLKASLR